MKLTLAPRLPAGQTGQDNQYDLGLIYGSIIVIILAGVYLVSRLSVLTACDAIAPLNLAKAFACPLKSLTDIPCLTCGMTRSVVLLAYLKVGRAFLTNPLVFLAMIMVLVWGCYTLVTRLLKARRITIKLSLVERKIFIFLGIIMVLANWLYLVLDGR